MHAVEVTAADVVGNMTSRAFPITIVPAFPHLPRLTRSVFTETELGVCPRWHPVSPRLSEAALAFIPSRTPARPQGANQ